MSNFRGMVLLLAAVTALSGCAAQQRRDAGTTLAAVGAVVALVGASVALGCLPAQDDADEHVSCSEESTMEPNPRAGAPILAIGIGTVITGSIIYGTGVTPRAK